MADDVQVVISRLDSGPRLVIEDAMGLALDFFSKDASSVGQKAYDARAGQGDPNRITADDVRAINETMRARARHSAWENEFAAVEPLPWLKAISLDWDLIATDEAIWRAMNATALCAEAVAKATGPYRGPSVATKVLHLKRPRIFPVLDSLVLEQIGATSQPVPALLDHLRDVGRANFEQLGEVRAALDNVGYRRTLIRILDALLWASHPDAGLAPQLGDWERVVRRRTA
jgi:hypothetical protein